MKRFFVDSYGITGLTMILICLTLLGGFIGFAVWAARTSREHAMDNRPPGVEIVVRPTSEWTGLFKYHDVDAGVICYGSPEGLSCVRER